MLSGSGGEDDLKELKGWEHDLSVAIQGAGDEARGVPLAEHPACGREPIRCGGRGLPSYPIYPQSISTVLPMGVALRQHVVHLALHQVGHQAAAQQLDGALGCPCHPGQQRLSRGRGEG